MENKTFEDFKNEVAVNHGYATFLEGIYERTKDTSRLTVTELINEAHELHLESEKQRIWKEACEAQNMNISTGFTDNLNKLEDDPKGQSIFRQIAKSIVNYPLAEYKP